MKSKRRHLAIVLVGIGLATGVGSGVWLVPEWRFRSEFRQARRAVQEQRYGEAGALLARLARRWPESGEVAYWLGNCKMIEGQNDEALEAWDRVADGARELPLAAMSRARLAIELCRYGLAEHSLKRAVRAGGESSDEAWQLLSRVYWITGRRDEYRRLLMRDAERTNDPSRILLTLWSLDHDPFQVEGISQALEKAKQSAPDDDRVWLALADLATRKGRFEEADRWLKRCEQARPDDQAVWKARLEWAKAAGRPDELVRAASHLPASSFTQASILELQSWLAAASGDRNAEQAALDKLLAVEPADLNAVERRADLAAQTGDTERLARLRHRKAELENAIDHYRQLVNHPELVPLAAELARSAETIGRRYDARLWWQIAARRDPAFEQEAAAAQARLATGEPPAPAGGHSLADVLGPFRRPGREMRPVAGVSEVPMFVELSADRSLRFTFDNGKTVERQLPETMSGGVGLLDFDGDGWLDIYAIQGGKFPPPAGPAVFGDRLFRNRGDGRFDDVTAASGLAKLPGGYGHGVAVGDYDNDGRPDLFITRWRSYALYHNAGGGCFEDATTAAGLGGDRDWPTSAAWADLDNDGDLDLYVCHYLKWDEVHPKLCDYAGKPEAGNNYCDPRGFPALPDHFFRNDGGRFVDVTGQTGFIDQNGRGLGVLAADLDDDGKIDLFVANDTSANYFLRNRGGFRFTEEGLESGLAASAGGGYLAGMGVACGDFDGDGHLDLAVTNFLNESTTLYHNHGGGLFSDRSADSGIAVATRLVLGFGLAALDANNDGYPDMAQANGHVSDNRPLLPYAMPAQLLLNDRAGRFTEVSDQAGPSWKIPRLGRGLAVGDLDNDGRIDVVIVSENAPLALLHNECSFANHSLTLLLEGHSSNRDAVGARVAVTVSGRTQVAARFGGGSYQSASDQRLHFGLGTALIADRVEITWPSGRRDCYQGLAADGAYRLREGDSSPRPLPRFSAAATKR